MIRLQELLCLMLKRKDLGPIMNWLDRTGLIRNVSIKENLQTTSTYANDLTVHLHAAHCSEPLWDRRHLTKNVRAPMM